VQQTLNEVIYEALLIILKDNKPSSNTVYFVRSIDRRIFWAIIEFLASLSIIYLVYKIGKSKKDTEIKETLNANTELSESLEEKIYSI